jgi:hypothetical protein
MEIEEMDTTRSDELVARYRKKGPSAKRKVQRYERDFSASPAELFPLLCPAREADWIPGWTSDLIYTTSGYVEPDCVFTTDTDNPLGEGIWVIYTHVPNECLELVRTSRDLVLQMRITISAAPRGGTRGRWTLTATSLTPQGSALVEAMPDQEPGFLSLLDGLDHYLGTGRLRGH